MLVLQLLILAVLLLIIPFFVGGIFSVVESGRGRRMFQWISGQFLIWVGIELIAVILIIRREELNKAVVLFWCYIAAVICFAVGTLICQKVQGRKKISVVQEPGKLSATGKVLWGMFGILLLLQLAQIVWDYYQVNKTMEPLPTFYVTSPFSMWTAFLSKSSGMRPDAIEQVVLPVVFVCMSYGVFYLLGSKLLVKKRKHQPMFLVILSLLAIGGEYIYKVYGAEYWPLSESKAEIMMLGCVLFPYLIFLLVLFGGMIGKRKIG